jgi:hypothetical protein
VKKDLTNLTLLNYFTQTKVKMNMEDVVDAAAVAPAPARVPAFLKKPTRVLVEAGSLYPDKHVCNKTLALLSTGKDRTFNPLDEGVLAVYCACFKMKGGDDDDEGQMRFVAAMQQLSPTDRKVWEEENRVDLDVFTRSMLKAISSLTDSENLKRFHDICSDLGTSHGSDQTIDSLTKVSKELTRAWTEDKTMFKILGHGGDVDVSVEVKIYIFKG